MTQMLRIQTLMTKIRKARRNLLMMPKVGRKRKRIRRKGRVRLMAW